MGNSEYEVKWLRFRLTYKTETIAHLNHEKNKSVANPNATPATDTTKKITGEFGALDIDVPRDRKSSFDLVILPKGQRRFTGLDDEIIFMYTRGMATREAQGHLQDAYGIEVSSSLISTKVKGKSEGRAINKAVHLTIGAIRTAIKKF